MESAEIDTQLCDNCKKSVSKINYSLHSVHCHRNISLCKICDEPYPKSEIDAHVKEAHTKINCDKCGLQIERQDADKHQVDDCVNRLVKCHICELDIAYCDLDGHIDYCGSRTERCATCGQYVMLKFLDIHLSSNHKFLTMDDAEPNNIAKPQPTSDFDFVHNATPRFPPHAFRPADWLRDLNAPFVDDLEYAHGHAFEDLLPQPALPSRDIEEDFESLLNLDDVQQQHFRLSGRQPIVPDESYLHDAFHSSDRFSPPSHLQPPTIAQHDDLIPCEFCGELFEAALITDHQDICEDNSPTNVYRSQPVSNDPIVVENTNQRSTDITLIPCEYCDKTFDSDFILEHQTACESGSRGLHDGSMGFIDDPPDVSPPNPSPPAQQPTSVAVTADDDMEYINDMFLKEAIENSLKEEKSVNKSGPVARPPVSVSSPRTPVVRNVPIRIESRDETDRRRRTADGTQVANGSSEGSRRNHAAGGTRPKSVATELGSPQGSTPPKAPTRRRSHRDQ